MPLLDEKSALKFSRSLLAWFDQHGRSSLPWQQCLDPYGIWISEIMLQQTRVETVIPYYQKFMARFPNIATLAKTELDEVMTYWAGLGYYARARYLHRAAHYICDHHDGVFPTTLDEVMALPGIGRSTAGAILAFSQNARHPILDGNVKRVLTRYFAIPGYPGTKVVENKLWEIADQLTPTRRIADYTQAIMDLGATLCTGSRPDCDRCPLQNKCVALHQGNPSSYPTRKPGANRPLFKSMMLLLQNSNTEYLLIKRPPSGIWGGLWVFPEITDAERRYPAWCDEELGLRVGAGKPLLTLRHGFTHFELEIEVIQCLIQQTADRVMDADHYLWYNPVTDAPIAIPSAVQKIFNQLSK